MSETPANQFGISADLPSLPVTVHPSVSIGLCRCSFVFCQLDAAIEMKNHSVSHIFFLSVAVLNLLLIQAGLFCGTVSHNNHTWPFVLLSVNTSVTNV